MRKIKPSVSVRDQRGDIIDLIENEEINAVTVVTFKKGAVRGNHYHQHTTQWNYLVSGKLRVVTQLKPHKAMETTVDPGEMVVIDPIEHHALIALEESEMIVFTRGPRGGKEYESDTYRLEAPLIK